MGKINFFIKESMLFVISKLLADLLNVIELKENLHVSSLLD